ncbi:MAG TPA: hypothetical protein VKG92_10990 [Flavobacteriales bacterium]|nr:hypothetical protein [Flavobacteriales bacterium]
MKLRRSLWILLPIGSILFTVIGARAQSLDQVGYFTHNGLFSVTGYDHYMLTGSGHLLDVQNPASPQLTGSVSAGLGTCVVVDDHYAYFGTGMSPSVMIVDLTVPSAPISLGSLPLAASAGVFGIAVDGDVLYAANAEQGLASIDISNPLSPALIEQLPFAGGDQARGVAVLGQFAYVADGSGLKIVDIADPSDMQVLGSLGSGYVSVAINADHTRLAVGQNAGGAIVFDLANPALPQVIYGVPGSNGPAYRVQMLDDRLYVSSEQYGVKAYAMGTGSATLLDGFSNIANGQSFSMWAQGDLVFVTGLVNGVAILQWTPVGMDEPPGNGPMGISCYPVPASTTLRWSVPNGTAWDEVRVLDLCGRIVSTDRTRNGWLDVAGIPAGHYALVLLEDGIPRSHASFVRE